MKNDQFKSPFQHLFALAIYLVLFFAFTFPSVKYFTSKIVGDGGDNLEYFAYVRMLKDNPLRTRSVLIDNGLYRYPNGLDASLSDGRIFIFVAGLIGIFTNPIIVYNSALCVLMVANAYISFLFYKLLTRNYSLGLLGGLINGFSYWVLVHAHGGISAISVFVFPLFGLLLLKIQKHPTVPLYIYLLVFCVYLAALSSVTQLVFGFVVILIALAIYCVMNRRSFLPINRTEHPALLHLVPALLLLFILLYWTFPSYFKLFVLNDIPVGNILIEKNYPSGITTLLAPPVNIFQAIFLKLILATINKTYNADFWYASLYVGAPTALLFFFTCLYAFKNKDKKLRFFVINTLFYATLLIIKTTFVFSWDISIENMPRWLMGPVYYCVNHINYFIVAFWFFLSGSIALYAKNSKLKTSAILVIFVAITLERINITFPLTDIESYDGHTYSPVVASLPGNAVFDLPLVDSTEYDLLPFSYKKAILGGRLHWLADGEEQKTLLLLPEISRFRCVKDFLTEKKEAPITQQTIEDIERSNIFLRKIMLEHKIYTIVIHKKIFYNEICDNVRKQGVMLFPDLTAEESRVDSVFYSSVREKAFQPPFFHREYVNDDVIIYQMNN